jgi:hypothetical protein
MYCLFVEKDKLRHWTDFKNSNMKPRQSIVFVGGGGDKCFLWLIFTQQISSHKHETATSFFWGGGDKCILWSIFAQQKSSHKHETKTSFSFFFGGGGWHVHCMVDLRSTKIKSQTWIHGKAFFRRRYRFFAGIALYCNTGLHRRLDCIGKWVRRQPI